jgi:hypothetical protein
MLTAEPAWGGAYSQQLGVVGYFFYDVLAFLQ